MFLYIYTYIYKELHTYIDLSLDIAVCIHMYEVRSSFFRASCKLNNLYRYVYYMCVLILLCVLIRLYVCPHTATCVLILQYMCPHTFLCVLILLSMCLHTTICVSLHCYMCVLILLYMCPEGGAGGAHGNCSVCARRLADADN